MFPVCGCKLPSRGIMVVVVVVAAVAVVVVVVVVVFVESISSQ